MEIRREHLAGLEIARFLLPRQSMKNHIKELDDLIAKASAASVSDDYPGITAEHLEAISRNSQADSENVLRLDALLSAKAQASAAPEQEPVAWVDPVALNSGGPAYDAGWRDGCSESKRLNTHADDGEVERLRADIEAAKEEGKYWHSKMRLAEVKEEKTNAKLAETQALLEDWYTANCIGEVNVSDKVYRIVTRTAAFLSATAQHVEHESDCSTNNRGVPELLGPCDCKGGAQ